MKPVLLIVILLTTYSLANAQNTGKAKMDSPAITVRCVPSRGGILAPKPMVIVYTRRQPNGISMDIDSMSKINPKYIKSINVLKDSIATKKFGPGAKAGVIQIYLDDDKYPDAGKLLLRKDTTKSIKQ